MQNGSERSTARPSVLFLSEAERPEQGSRLYRCVYQAKQLTQAGLPANVVYYREATKAQLDAADIWVFSRCRFDETSVDLVQRGRRANKLLCGDLDDRIFTPWDADSTGYMRSRARPQSTVTARQAALERETLRLLPAFEFVMVSTPGIREELEALGIPAHVAPNAFDSERFKPIERTRERLGSILIMSGTPTHDADLRRIAPALADFLAKCPEVRCTLLGSLQPAAPLFGLSNVKTQALLPVSELYPFVAKHDLCLVPLEPTSFNDCKSALKFIECGAVSVPVLASPRREYRSIVRHEENGFLAGDDEDSWYEALCRIHAAPELVARAARGAYETVIAEHTVQSRKSALAGQFQQLWNERASSARARRA